MPAILALDVRDLVPQKVEGPSRYGKLLPNGADFDDREGLRKNHRHPPVMLVREYSALSQWQAGFRKRRNTTDQCLRLSQFISDVFVQNQCRRTIATFFDFSLAYDRVWGTGLLMKMSKMGDPDHITEWQSFWYINHKARV